MAIGEFGGAPAPGDTGPMYAAPAYWLYEMSQAALNPSRAFADAARLFFRSPANPLSYTAFGKTMAAGLELFERSTRRYGKPDWNITSTVVGGENVPVRVSVLWERPFCRLLHFERAFDRPPRRPQPRLLIVAPMSGHYPTLLRGTVEGFLPNHDVYLTEWVDARMVPVSQGAFDLDDYIDYLISILHLLAGDVHVLAVCQPSVPVLAAVACMEADEDPYVPHSMVLMGGPIDTRVNPTAVNIHAERRGVDWFRRNVITKVPFPNPGFMRDVYPGFLQLHGFVSMNLDRHIEAHRKLFLHLVQGDGDSAQKHREFYDEYLAVMDLAAEFYLQTVDTVFVRHALPKGEMTHRGIRIDPTKIRRVALFTVEGEHDDISLETAARRHGEDHLAQGGIDSQRVASRLTMTTQAHGIDRLVEYDLERRGLARTAIEQPAKRRVPPESQRRALHVFRPVLPRFLCDSSWVAPSLCPITP
ncbi:MAG: polyhydroxyalkanoate depolymerase [Alphaproteobacteria bacterium]|nr:MAG: polyhydroxyalkanoate depolymerase [Alphaproteobacteria bacterium]